MPLARVTVHRIDADDRISYVDGGFREAATEHGLPDLPERVLGQPLVASLHGHDTRFWYDMLIKHARLWGAVSFPFRCDTPTLRRWLTMEMARVGVEMVEFTCLTTREEPTAVMPVLDPVVPRSVMTVVMCSWCKRIRSVIGWLELTDAVSLLEVFSDPLPPRIEYGICPDDVARFRSLLA